MFYIKYQIARISLMYSCNKEFNISACDKKYPMNCFKFCKRFDDIKIKHHNYSIYSMWKSRCYDTTGF